MNANKFFVDTNIFLRVYARDDEAKATDCEIVLAAVQTGQLKAVISDLVLAEFVWTSLSYYKVKKVHVSKMVKAILGIHHLTVAGDADMPAALGLYDQYSVKFIDAVIASYRSIQQQNLAILSYDQDFDRIGIKRYEPADVIKKYAL